MKNKSNNNKVVLSKKHIDDLLQVLKVRFNENMNRHKNLSWPKIEKKLLSNKAKISSLYQMEDSGGEPDVVDYDKKTDTYVFFDCSPESPSGRRSVCYDLEGLRSRKEHKPKNNAVDMCQSMGVELLDEVQYRKLQNLGEFDLKTSSWLKTSENIRSLGGVIFGDRRYDQVFIYHNGASSYYAVRGFRTCLIL